MRAVVQRVSSASVAVDGAIVGEIGPGFLVLLAAGEGDTEAEARWLAHKTANLRIFGDADGKMNLSVQAIGGSALVISQFTLYGDIRRGFRPSFVKAAPPDVAEKLINVFVEALRAANVPTATGVFRAHMHVSLVNDGPVTIILDKEPGDPNG
ncbi:MAG TPA: D-aminoacyl-tRNA deacylase [Anaerolineae bacterium]|nr:D-aminoacyl-tRNA deacylase [Anaerolineae bacterium]HQI83711.1 D-aminoacyl-tRNA deacylase [Anaerolineae bacterium]